MCRWGKELGLVFGREVEVGGWDFGYELSKMGVRNGVFCTVLGGPRCPEGR